MKRITPVLLLCLSLAACGMEGPAGPAGRNGTDGKSGVGLVSSIQCLSYLPLDTAKNLGADVIYNVYQFNDGTVMTSCNASYGQIGASGFAVFKQTQSGAATGNCLLRDDADTISGGFMTFQVDNINSAPPAALIRYTDIGSPYNGRTWTIGCTKT